jgi:hypothetical protein
MTKLLIGVLSLALLGSGVLVGFAGGLDSDPARSVSLPGSTTLDDGTTTGQTTTGTTTSRPENISGPCDEVEHRDDPRCAGVNGTATTGATTTVAGDISGPCYEVEHRNDPRCTGAPRDDDNSGPGAGDDNDREDNSGPGSGDDRDDDDRSGSNSGRG